MNFGISIVIINYNGARFLPKLFDSLRKAVQGYDYEIIFIDNNSTDNSVDIVKKHLNHFRKFEFLKFKRNLGYCKAVNFGVIKANNEFIIILNSDLYVDQGFIYPIIKNFIKDRNIAVVQPLIYDYFNTSFIQSKGFFLDEAFNYINNKNSRIILCPFGAAFAVRKSAILKSGLWDPIYFMYGDEADLGLSIWTHGYKAIVEHESKVYHYGGGSREINEWFIVKHILMRRNQILNILKHSDDLMDLILRLIIIFYINLVRMVRNKYECYAILNAYYFLLKNIKYFIIYVKNYRMMYKRKFKYKIKDLRKLGLIKPLRLS